MSSKLFSHRVIFLLALTLNLVACLSESSSSADPAPAPTQSILVPEATQSAPQPPAIPERRRLTLEYPPRMRAGVDGDIIRLTLEVDELGNLTPTAEVEGNVITGETIEIPNLYETHDVIAEARLDLAGMQVRPPDSVFEPLKPGQSVTFYWSIRPQDPGQYTGTVWLHLNFRDKSTREESRIAVSAQIVEIEAVDFFGLPVNVVRTSGVIGSVVGGILGFPFLEQILRFVFGKRKPRRR